MKKFIIVITGPTASGKSDLSEKIALEINGEIINADIGSWYTPLNIGTAKPNLETMPVAHHLFNIFNQPDQFTIVAFRNRVEKIIQEIWSRNKTPIIVGGSAFYIKSLWYKVQDSGSDQKLEQSLMSSAESTVNLWNKLFEIDPVRAENIDKNDRYRIVRALGIYQSTGKKPSEFTPIFDPIAPAFTIFCQRNREDLYNKVNVRTEIMLQEGWIEETDSLINTPWEKFLLDKKIIGYDDIVRYLHSSKTQEDYTKLIATIQQKTRNYAKRQVTFLKKLQKELQQDSVLSSKTTIVSEIDLTLCDVGLYINGLSNQLFKLFN